MSNNTSKKENGTSHVNIGSMPSGSNEQVIAQALSTFALQLPSTIQASIRSSTLILCFLITSLMSIVCGVSIYFYFTIKSEVEDMHLIFRKMDDRHQRLIQYAKEQDYRILTKEAR